MEANIPAIWQARINKMIKDGVAEQSKRKRKKKRSTSSLSKDSTNSFDSEDDELATELDPVTPPNVFSLRKSFDNNNN